MIFTPEELTDLLVSVDERRTRLIEGQEIGLLQGIPKSHTRTVEEYGMLRSKLRGMVTEAVSRKGAKLVEFEEEDDENE